MNTEYTFEELSKLSFKGLSGIGQALIEELAIIEMKKYQKISYILFLQDKIKAAGKEK